jgi:hypothetical protein
MIIAVDFDGTLAFTEYPKILCPITRVVNYCKRRKELGDTLILWTCRHGESLAEAVEFCEKFGLTFDYVNENPPDRVSMYGDCRKVYADIYIDDHNRLLSQITEVTPHD